MGNFGISFPKSVNGMSVLVPVVTSKIDRTHKFFAIGGYVSEQPRPHGGYISFPGDEDALVHGDLCHLPNARKNAWGMVFDIKGLPESGLFDIVIYRRRPKLSDLVDRIECVTFGPPYVDTVYPAANSKCCPNGLTAYGAFGAGTEISMIYATKPGNFYPADSVYTNEFGFWSASFSMLGESEEFYVIVDSFTGGVPATDMSGKFKVGLGYC